MSGTTTENITKLKSGSFILLPLKYEYAHFPNFGGFI